MHTVGWRWSEMMNAPLIVGFVGIPSSLRSGHWKKRDAPIYLQLCSASILNEQMASGMQIYVTVIRHNKQVTNRLHNRVELATARPDQSLRIPLINAFFRGRILTCQPPARHALQELNTHWWLPMDWQGCGQYSQFCGFKFSVQASFWLIDYWALVASCGMRGLGNGRPSNRDNRKTDSVTLEFS